MKKTISALLLGLGLMNIQPAFSQQTDERFIRACYTLGNASYDLMLSYLLSGKFDKELAEIKTIIKKEPKITRQIFEIYEEYLITWINSHEREKSPKLAVVHQQSVDFFHEVYAECLEVTTKED